MVARRAHNPKVVGSSPSSATNKETALESHLLLYCAVFLLSENPRILCFWGLFGVYCIKKELFFVSNFIPFLFLLPKKKEASPSVERIFIF